MKNNNWEEKSLNELGTLGRGKSKHRPRNASVLYGGPYPFIQTGDITHSGLHVLKYTQTYSEVGLAQSKMWDQDTLCIVNAGVNTGDSAILAFRACFPDSIIGFVADSEKCDVRFIKYFLDSIKTQIRQVTMGATQDNLSVSKLLSFRVPTPDIRTQSKIASVLSAYDNLIENNTRRICVLEDMVQRIYEEWFIRFRFPGYNNIEMIESELGLIPKGWNIYPVQDTLSHNIGGGWGEETATGEFCVPAYVIRGTDIPAINQGSLGKAPLRFHKESNFRSRRIEPGDIVFEVSGGSKDQPVGRTVLVNAALLQKAEFPVICASFCRLIRVNSEKMLPELLLLHCKRIYKNRDIMKYQTQSTGITNLKITFFIKNEKLIIPEKKLQILFVEEILPLWRLAEHLGLKNANLQATRDLLLPKLISGEIDVSDVAEKAAAL